MSHSIMSTRSSPSIDRALVLVSQPVTAAAWPVISWFMSLPILTTSTSPSSIPFLASRARKRMTAVGWVAIVLPTISFGSRIGSPASEK